MASDLIAHRLHPRTGLDFPPQFSSTLTCIRIPNFEFYSGRIVRFNMSPKQPRHIELWSPNSPVVPYCPGEHIFGFRPCALDGLPEPSARRQDGSLGRFDHTLYPQFFSRDLPWQPFVAPPPDEFYNCEIDWMSFERYWTIDPLAGEFQGSIGSFFLTLIMRRVNDLETRLAAVDAKITNDHYLHSVRPSPIDQTVFPVLKKTVSFYTALDLVTRLQRQCRETRAFIHYAEAYLRCPPYTASHMPAELETTIRLPLASSSGYIGVWANGMEIWEVAWYARRAGVPLFFAAELTQEQVLQMSGRAQIMTFAERTVIQNLVSPSSITPYQSLHSSYRTCPPIYHVNVPLTLGIPDEGSFSTSYTSFQVDASSSSQGWIGAIYLAMSDRMAHKFNQQKRAALMLPFQAYLDRTRTHLPVVTRPARHVPNEGMGPLDNHWGSGSGWNAETSLTWGVTNHDSWDTVENFPKPAEDSPPLYTARPSIPQNSVERCQFKELERVVLGSELRVPWIKPPPVAYKGTRTQRWPCYLLVDVIDCPDEVQCLRERYPYAFKMIGRNNDDRREAAFRWYDRHLQRILLFPGGGHLKFPTGYCSRTQIFGVPVPKYPFFCDFNDRLVFHTSSYWMYPGQDEGNNRDRADTPPDPSKLPLRNEVNVLEETIWEEVDDVDSDFIPVPVRPRSPRAPEDADPVPPYDAPTASEPKATMQDSIMSIDGYPAPSLHEHHLPSESMQVDYVDSAAPAAQEPSFPMSLTRSSAITRDSTLALVTEPFCSSAMHVDSTVVSTIQEPSSTGLTPSVVPQVNSPITPSASIATRNAATSSTVVGSRETRQLTKSQVRKRRRVVLTTSNMLRDLGFNVEGDYGQPTWDAPEWTEAGVRRRIMQDVGATPTSVRTRRPDRSVASVNSFSS